MSIMSSAYEERLCRICDGYDVTWRDGHMVMLKTGVRSYKHPHCMVEKLGLEEAIAEVPHKWQIKLFKQALKFPIQKGGKHPLAQSIASLKRSSR